jgi:hypothetical protein
LITLIRAIGSLDEIEAQRLLSETPALALESLAAERATVAGPWGQWFASGATGATTNSRF